MRCAPTLSADAERVRRVSARTPQARPAGSRPPRHPLGAPEACLPGKRARAEGPMAPTPQAQKMLEDALSLAPRCTNRFLRARCAPPSCPMDFAVRGGGFCERTSPSWRPLRMSEYGSVSVTNERVYCAQGPRDAGALRRIVSGRLRRRRRGLRLLPGSAPRSAKALIEVIERLCLINPRMSFGPRPFVKGPRPLVGRRRWSSTRRTCPPSPASRTSCSSRVWNPRPAPRPAPRPKRLRSHDSRARNPRLL
jgi:hypothetical protein